MRELSLFTGAGGGLLGTKLLGWEHIGYVEINEYCQRIIAQRIKDGILDDAPIFGDIRAFINEGYADSYKGMVDVITAGFPCQPFSLAGKQQGEHDERNMWPATIDVICRVRPRFCLLENVPGLLANKYIQRIFGDLAESGFDARWCVLGAGRLGASHRRDRLWILSCNTKYNSVQRRKTKTAERGKKSREQQLSGLVQFGAWPTLSECRAYGKDNGISDRVDRLKALGNGQVPICAATAWKLLSGMD